jgi:hypothetical protein
MYETQGLSQLGDVIIDIGTSMIAEQMKEVSRFTGRA